MLLARSGLPYTVQLGTTRSGTGWTTNQRPNAVPGVDGTGNPDGPNGWLNIAGFSDPAAGTFGNLGRNTERGPKFVQLDMSLLKRTTHPRQPEAGVPRRGLQHPEPSRSGRRCRRACS